MQKPVSIVFDKRHARTCPCRKPDLAGKRPRIGGCCCAMRDLCRLIGWLVVDLIRSRAALEAEIWTLRQQINVLRRTAPKKLSFSAIDRLVFVGLYRLFPDVRNALAIVKPETIVRWHRAGFSSYWRWKSRRRFSNSRVSTKSEFQIIDRSDTAMSDRPFQTSCKASLPSCRILSVRHT